MVVVYSASLANEVPVDESGLAVAVWEVPRDFLLAAHHAEVAVLFVSDLDEGGLGLVNSTIAVCPLTTIVVFQEFNHRNIRASRHLPAGLYILWPDELNGLQALVNDLASASPFQLLHRAAVQRQAPGHLSTALSVLAEMSPPVSSVQRLTRLAGARAEKLRAEWATVFGQSKTSLKVCVECRQLEAVMRQAENAADRMTVRELADYLGVSERTLRRQARRRLKMELGEALQDPRRSVAVLRRWVTDLAGRSSWERSKPTRTAG